MSAKITTQFTAHWIGRCPRKGCRCVKHVDVPMVRESWTEQHHNHAHGFSFDAHKSRVFAVGGFSPSHLDLHCVAHKWALRWQQVDGHKSEEHVCDARCMNAIGPSCDCSCGGSNHGRGYHINLTVAIGGAQ